MGGGGGLQLVDSKLETVQRFWQAAFELVPVGPQLMHVQ